MKQFLANFGIDLTLMITGMFGSLLMVSKQSAKNWKTVLLGIATGTLSANYLTQIAVDLLGLQGKSEYGVAFLLGYFGLKGVENLAATYLKRHEK